jgi:hypothetical protein
MGASVAAFEIETPPVLADERLRSLYKYWHELGARAGGIPSIQAFDPLHLPRLLPNIWVLEVAPETRRFRTRLAGETINAVYGRSIAGQYFDDVFAPSEVALIVERYPRALSAPAIFTAVGEVYGAAGRLTHGERLALPMLGRSGLTDTMLGGTVYGGRLDGTGRAQVSGGVPSFHPFRAANHRAPEIAGG